VSPSSPEQYPPIGLLTPLTTLATLIPPTTTTPPPATTPTPPANQPTVNTANSSGVTIGGITIPTLQGAGNSTAGGLTTTPQLTMGGGGSASSSGSGVPSFTMGGGSTTTSSGTGSSGNTITITPPSGNTISGSGSIHHIMTAGVRRGTGAGSRGAFIRR